ncbi:2-dehydropantoate 2-reductase [Nitratifractor salsuginis DSM 16511]|uniref:2-dehydropantoate 2-reductase n=2 Tax=Nitratifractor salsuginis TaxID=269261 RepID=E6X057_NITSE|nr:2-dehydropantoate 2-reductase [Nitratifractor salsuginis DSM 16511]
MKIMILGAGGVGGYLGARFLRAVEPDVTLVARGAHLDKIRQEGLTILEDTERYTVHPAHATDDPEGLGLFDLILVTLKDTDLDDGLERIRNNVGPQTVILPLLNGVEYRPRILKRYPQADVLEGCIYILSNIVEPGVIRKKGKIFRLCWGKEGFDPADYRPIVELFDRALPRHKPTAEIAYEQWKKFLFISPMAVLTSIYKVPMDRIAQEHADELRELTEEIAALAQAKGVPLTRQDVEATLEQAAKVLPGAKTSMQLDIERNKPAEIEALAGYVVREGDRLGVKVPTMEKLYRALRLRTSE